MVEESIEGQANSLCPKVWITSGQSGRLPNLDRKKLLIATKVASMGAILMKAQQCGCLNKSHNANTS